MIWNQLIVIEMYRMPNPELSQTSKSLDCQGKSLIPVSFCGRQHQRFNWLDSIIIVEMCGHAICLAAVCPSLPTSLIIALYLGAHRTATISHHMLLTTNKLLSLLYGTVRSVMIWNQLIEMYRIPNPQSPRI